MSHAVAFDTLAYAKKLESSGIAVKQAEAHAEALANVLEVNFISRNESNRSYDKLVNLVKQESSEIKQQFNQLEQTVDRKINELHHEITRVEQTVDRKINELHHEINQNKVDLIKWVIGLAFAQTALTFSILKFFHI